MQNLLRTSLVVLSFAFAWVAAAVEQPPIFEYTSLSHTLKLTSFRAGQHDPSGVNNYYFQAVMRSQLLLPEEMKLPMEKRKTQIVDLGTFAELELPALNIWKPAETVGSAPPTDAGSNMELTVLGDDIRKLVAKTMNAFNVKEERIEIQIEVTLFEKAKKFIFLGEDEKIGSAVYSPLPVAGLTAKPPTDQTLKMTDEKGAVVTLAVHFDPKLAPKP